VTGTRPERPALATVVCFYEIVIVVLEVIAYFFLRYFVPHTSHAEVYYHPTLRQNLASGLFCILALAGAVALWQMRRSSVIFLGARFAFNVVLYAVGLVHPAITGPHPGHNPTIPAYLFGLIGVTLSASIAWYAYDITSPNAPSPPNPEAQSYA
jgi:hypothetical protein